MRCLIVGNFQSDTLGSHTVCKDIAARLANSGWSVIATSTRVGRFAWLLDMLATTWRRRDEYDVAQVDVYSGKAFLWAEAVCWALRTMGKPYVLTLHGGNLPNFAGRWTGRVQRLLQSAAVVTTPSSYLFDRMKPYRADLRVLPNALDIDLYPSNLRSELKPRLVWLRAFHETYNPPLAPKVVALLAQEFAGVHITMMGPDKGDGSLENTRRVAANLRVSDRVSIVGAVGKSEVVDWLNKGDIFLNTTNVDNTPVSVLEAMACGLCVVSTNVGGLPWLLEHEHDALLVPRDDPLAAAAAVRRLLTEPRLAEKLSRNARAKVTAHDWSNVLPEWTALLSAVVRETRMRWEAT